MPILFTQYKLPRGTTEDVTTNSSPEIEKLAWEMLDFGFHFDIEILSTGMISMTCEKEDEVMGIELSSNGPEITKKCEDMISRSYKKWKEEMPELLPSTTNWRARYDILIKLQQQWDVF